MQVVLQNPEKLDEAPHQTIFHRMLDAKAHRSQTVPDAIKLQDEGLTLIFAGANTVADTMLMGHWNILDQPELLTQLRVEVLSVWPVLHTTLDLKDLGSLSLLTATIKESLRHIPLGVSLTRVVLPAGAVISSQKIPGRTTVGMAILHVHQSEEILEDALDFKPDR